MLRRERERPDRGRRPDVAMPTWRRFVGGVDTLDGSDEGEEADELPTLPPVLPPPKPPETTPRRGRHRWG